MVRRGTAIIALLLLSRAGLADTPAQARKAIEAIYAKDAAAFARKDTDAISAYQAPDYVAISKAGKRYSREQAQQMLRRYRNAKTLDVKTRIVSFSLKGDTAFARTKVHTSLTIVNPRTHKMVAATANGVSEDIWVKRGGKWLIKQDKEIASAQKITGTK